MNEKLTEMVKKNIFVNLAVSGINLKFHDLLSIEELVALYLAMRWIDAEEAKEILEYAKLKLTTVEEKQSAEIQ